MENVIKMVAVGDLMLGGKGMFDHCRPILKGADITFGQLEQTLTTRNMVRPFSSIMERTRRQPGEAPRTTGFPHIDPQEKTQLMVDAGFNILSFASNHSMHYGEEGMQDTLDIVRKNKIAVIGAGKNIDEATKPYIFDIKGTKIGFLAYCSVVIPGDEATPNKGGVAPVRATTCYEQFDWQPGSPPRVHSVCIPEDVAGMQAEIKALKKQVDIVAVSWHWGVHFVRGYIADYQFEAGHAAIDAGADIMLGHHAHILKGIEVYKGKPIFYSMCNFSSGYGGPPGGQVQDMDSGRTWATVFGYRWEYEKTEPLSYGYPKDARKSIMVKCDIADKKIQRAAYLPLWMNDKGEPVPVSRSDPRSDEHFEWMQWMCGDQALDTKFAREGDEVVVVTK